VASQTRTRTLPATRPYTPAPTAAPASGPSVRDARGPRARWGSGSTPQFLSGSKYQSIILAEFIGTLLLTVLTPIAKDDAKEGLSPYAGADMVKLASIVLLFFLLAAVSAAGPSAARLCAWLGGLVLITDGLYEASNLSKDLALFTGKVAQAANAGESQ